MLTFFNIDVALNKISSIFLNCVNSIYFAHESKEMNKKRSNFRLKDVKTKFYNSVLINSIKHSYFPIKFGKIRGNYDLSYDLEKHNYFESKVL